MDERSAVSFVYAYDLRCSDVPQLNTSLLRAYEDLVKIGCRMKDGSGRKVGCKLDLIE